MWFTLFVTLNAISVQELSGNWSAYRETNSHGTVTIEKEYLHLNANHTFNIELFVSVEKGEVPFAKEIYLISQESLRNLANNFKHKYENEPLRIIEIKSFTARQLVTSNEAMLETVYTRQ
jgi:hypothetical protein